MGRISHYRPNAVCPRADRQKDQHIKRITEAHGVADMLGGICEANYREEDYEEAADHLVRIYQERLLSEATIWVEKPYDCVNFERNLPCIKPERVSAFEYETEWFPIKP